MKISTDLYKRATIILKEVISEAYTSCYHGHAQARGIYLRNGGIRISEDSAILISPEHIYEYVIPYVEEMLQYFGGGFIHFCGYNEHLLDAFLSIKEVRAINLGNPEMYDLFTVMSKFIQNNKVYFGRWPKESNESYEDFLNRMIEASNGGKRGLLLQFDEDMYQDVDIMKIYNYWINGVAGE
jgi:hypothetical protein